jgi:hypothetical protein
MIGANPAHTRQIALSREIARSYESIGVHTLLPEKNLGCYLGNREAISWFFSKVNSGIILEDDMWPNSDFLNFATQGLRYYEQNFKVGSISGTNIVPKGDLDKFSSVGNFRFSKYSSSWGWATWSNRWGKFIASANNSEIREITHHVFTSRISRSYWRQVMFETYQNENDSWAMFEASSEIPYEQMEKGASIIPLGELYSIKRSGKHKFRQYALGNLLKEGKDF